MNIELIDGRLENGEFYNLFSNKRLWTKPLDLLEQFEAYMTWNEANPIKVKERFGIDLIEVEKPRIMSIRAFALFMGMSEKALKTRIENSYIEWSKVEMTKELVAQLKEVHNIIIDSCNNQKFSYAAVGIFKENLVIRDLGLADRTEVQAPIAGQLSAADVKAISDKLDEEFG